MPFAVGIAQFKHGSCGSSSNQRPELVLNAFLMLFTSQSSHFVVPRVVYNFDGSENKIKTKQAIWGGSMAALVMYLIWDTLILGNTYWIGAISAVWLSMQQ